MKLELRLQPQSPVQVRAWLIFRVNGVAVNELYGNLSPELAAFLEAELSKAGVPVTRDQDSED